MPSKIGIAGLAVYAFLCTSPASAQVFNPETTRLDNGLEVVILPNHRAPVVTHMLWFKAGALDDPWGTSGIAHFLEHLMFKGTKKYPEGAYSRIISEMGGQENAFTSYDYTAYYATFGKQYLEKIIELESDRLQNWQVTEDQVARERQVILKERQQVTENNPVAHFFEDVNAVLYTNSPYQRPIIGWTHEMAQLSKKDAEDFVATHYAPNNAILVLSGDITLDEVKPLLQKYYAPIKPRAIAPRTKAQAVTLPSTLNIEKTSPLVEETIWSRHRLVKPARPETIRASDAQIVLTKMLGDSRIGRLYRRLVMKDKLATNASISFDPQQIGMARFAIVVTPRPGVDLKKIEQAADDEIAILLKKGVTDYEVSQATQALDIETVYARDSVQGPAMMVGQALASGLDIETIEEWPQRVKSITKTDVEKAARDLFAPEVPWVTAVLHPGVKK